MEFRDSALGPDGNLRDGYAAGANYLSDCGGWRVVASDVLRPGASEWQVWQHVGGTTPRSAAGNWRRRLPWVRLPLPEHAQAVADVLAALPLNASWAVARLAVRDALRTAGAALFFRGVFFANQAATRLAARVRERGRPPAEPGHGQ